VKGDRAFKIKLRPTEERPPTLMLPKPLRGINDTYLSCGCQWLPRVVSDFIGLVSNFTPPSAFQERILFSKPVAILLCPLLTQPIRSYAW
jgi:hypothetical protein